jgi:cellulose synthase/poly-beta-1,6-N-acetylglucosamine synthase-like glycosyltransferase
MNFRLFSFNILNILIGLIFLLITIFHLYFGYINLFHYPSLWVKVLVSTQLLVELLILFFTVLFILLISTEKILPYYDMNKLMEIDWPEIDLIIPVKRVPLHDLEPMLKTLQEIDYPKDKLNVFVADDTVENEREDNYEEKCLRYGVNYLYDPTNRKFKAGMVNIALRDTNSPVVAFFDYDQLPTKQSLKVMVYELLNNPDLAFVQCKKEFRGLHSIIKFWSAMLYLQLFEVMQQGKQNRGAPLFVGSTAVFRRTILNSVGGFTESTFTEDTDTTVLLLSRGIHGKFINFVGSIGSIPQSYGKQVAQVWRWSHGGSHVLKLRFFELLTSSKIKISQKIDTLSTLLVTPLLCITYLYGLSFLILLYYEIDSVRFTVFGISSLVIVPLISIYAYSIIVILAVHRRNKYSESEYGYWQLPVFILVSMSSNLLMLSAAFLGLFGILGPDSKQGEWNRNLFIKHQSIFFFIVGMILLIYSIHMLLAGFPSAILVISLAITFIPPVFISLIYK